MTQKEIDAKRYWTPRLGLITVVLNIAGVGLWWFVTGWMTDIKTEVKEIHAELKSEIHEISERRLVWTAWKQEVIDKVENIDNRLVKVERKSDVR